MGVRIGCTWRTWSPADDARLDVLWNQQRLGYGEIMQIMPGRTRKALAQRVAFKKWQCRDGSGRPWTAENDAEVYRLWTVEGLSYNQIAEAIGRTASAVIGHVHRKGWRYLNPRAAQLAVEAKAAAARGKAASMKARAATAKPRPDPATRPADRFAIPSPGARLWSERERFQCAFPIKPDGEYTLSCCNPAHSSPYCAAHEWIVYSRGSAAAA